MGKKKIFKTLLVTAFMALSMAFTSFAAVSYSMSEEVSQTKEIKWWSDSGNAEYRYLVGASDASGFDAATPAGSGGSASIVLHENGNVTVYAKEGDTISCTVVPVTTIDYTAPSIHLENVTSDENGLMTITYSASDFSGIAETRLKEGNCSEGDYSSAKVVSQGTLQVTTGDYTLFAKDMAGNINTYYVTAAHTDGSSEDVSSKSSSWSTEYSYEYWDADITVYRKEENTTAVIYKSDLTTGAPVIGAKLEVVNTETGDIVDSWTTSNEAHAIKGLKKGVVYRLTETTAPDGYEVAESIEFTLNADGSTTKVVMKDAPVGKEIVPTPVPTTKPSNPVNPNPPATNITRDRYPQTGGLDNAAVMLIGGVMLTVIGLAGLTYMRMQKR